ncbi:hypothetical protein E1176_19915 [Fulvivirga sp. RKSG066]|uniref:hypothetical protein n=1 Tax=Fulvivirga aurantia TaxID=2529383 RepID=UPI0012BCA892|nr:hypothetical protein [Fulvivirga aurantia]MTI23306.1 hypothetical protein [Fulvivirga aurantia]
MKSKKFLFLSFFLVSLSLSTSSWAQVESTEPGNGLFYYTGTLGYKQQIEFNLQFTDNNVSGSYIVVESGDMYVFSGRLALNKSGIGVLVYDSDNDYIASIEAVFVTDANNFGKQLNGKWKPNKGEIKTLRLKKVAEFAHQNEVTNTNSEVLGE